MPPTLDVIAVGEVLVDLISTDMVTSLADATVFRRFLGGQVANVALNVSRLGGRAAVVGCVGHDGFGQFIRRELTKAGVAVDALYEVPDAPTTVSVITRHTTTPLFIIYRGADVLLTPDHIPAAAIASARAVHASTFGLSREPSRSAVLHALRLARQSGCLVSLDPNYHPSIWDNAGDVLNVLAQAYAFVDLTKPSLDDCTRLFGPDQSPQAYVERFLKWGVQQVALTMGQDGVLLASQTGEMRHLTSQDVPVADVTGAGDAFWAGLIMGLLDGLTPEQAAEFAQVVAEAKVRTLGPLPVRLDRQAIYRQLWGDA